MNIENSSSWFVHGFNNEDLPLARKLREKNELMMFDSEEAQEHYWT